MTTPDEFQAEALAAADALLNEYIVKGPAPLREALRLILATAYTQGWKAGGERTLKLTKETRATWGRGA